MRENIKKREKMQQEMLERNRKLENASENVRKHNRKYDNSQKRWKNALIVTKNLQILKFFSLLMFS